MRLVTLGVGAQNSPRYAPAGLLVAHGGVRVMIDGGPRAVPPARLDAWLVTDRRGELIAAIRRLAEARGLVPYAGPFSARGLRITDRTVVHTSHPTWGYRIEVSGLTVVWAPEFYEFPRTVARTGHQEDRKIVQRATAAVFHALRDRLTPNEADQVFAQLPEELKRIWGEGEEAEREPIKMNREEFYERVLRDAGLPSKREARWMILAVFAALKEQISPGEAQDVMAQLPKDLKELWDEAQAEV